MLKSTRGLLVETFRLYREQFWLYIGFAAWLILPIAAFLILTTLPVNPVITIFFIISIIAQIFVSLWVTVCIIRVTVALRTNKSIDQRKLSKNALKSVQPLLAVAFLQALITLGGFLLLIVPGIIFWIWYSQAQMVAVLERQHPIASLSSSRAMVRGRFRPVLWRLVSGPVFIGFGYAFILSSALLIVAGILGLDTSTIFSENSPLWTELIKAMADVFVIPLFIIYSTLLYQNLKNTPLEARQEVA